MNQAQKGIQAFNIRLQFPEGNYSPNKSLLPRVTPPIVSGEGQETHRPVLKAAS